MSRWLSRAKARARQEDGISLVEMMVAVFILGLVMSAFAGSLIKMLQTTSRNEQDVRATALVQQLVEELRVAEWDDAVLYADETAPDASDPDQVRWYSRLTEDADGNLLLDGERLVTIPGPPEDEVDAGTGKRNPATLTPADVPYPTGTVTTGNITYTTDRYIVFTTRVVPNDTRKFVAITRWIDRFGIAREVRFEAERVPTPEESAQTDDGLRINYFLVNPNPVVLNSTSTLADPSKPIKVEVHTNKPLALNGSAPYNVYLTYEYLLITPIDPDDPTQGSTYTRATSDPIAMTGSDSATSQDPEEPTTTYTGFVTWTTTLDADVTFFEGFSTFTFIGADACIACDGVIQQKAVEFRNGYPDPGPDGTGTIGTTGDPTGTETEEESPTPTPSVAAPDITSVTVSTFCTNGSGKPSQDVTFNVFISGLDPVSDGSLAVTYQTNNSGAGNGTGSWVSGTQWRFTIAKGFSDSRWDTASTYPFVFRITRGSDGLTDSFTRFVTIC